MANVLGDITARYSAVEAWLYDRFIAPAVVEVNPGLVDELLGHVPHGASVLDVGCGGGQLVLAVAERRPDLKLSGVDLSPDQVARATRRARSRARFVQGSALDLPFSDGTFDAVVSVASIKHWPDKRRGVEECVRVLKPWGTLAVLEADRGCSLDDARSFVRRWRVPRPLEVPMLMLFRTYVAGQGLDLDEARALLAGLPFDEPRVERVPGAPAVLLGGRLGGKLAA